MTTLQREFDTIVTLLAAPRVPADAITPLRDGVMGIAKRLEQPALEGIAEEMLVDVATLIRAQHSHSTELTQVLHLVVQMLVDRGDRLTHSGAAPWMARRRCVCFSLSFHRLIAFRW